MEIGKSKHKNWASIEGIPGLSGVVWIEEEKSYNFTLFSREAIGVTLLIYDDVDYSNPVFKYSFNFLINKSQGVWHCRIPQSKIGNGKYYGYQVEGPWNPFKGQRFDPEKILLDPYAQAVFFPPEFSREAASFPGSNVGKAPLGILPTKTPLFNWEEERRLRHTNDAIIYELHIRAFTMRHNSGVSESNRGTFEGIVQKIPYLKELGVTILELMPVFQSDPQDPETFWGYMPLSFFSPQCTYAESRIAEEVKNEFKWMVKKLHEADIEVILDVVYNHTVEADEHGPCYSYRGIDNSTFYLLTEDMSQYRNDSGTGNTLRCAHPYVRKLIVESMRYWVKEMHVDGFRFDLASIFARNLDGSLNLTDPPIISEITTDPDFSNIRLIAEVWDLSSFLLGKKFPGSSWFQWNAHFRDDIRSYVKGDLGMVPALMSRLYGSNDLFPDTLHDAYRPWQSINYITSHDGFTLNDLVSYNDKHNEANGKNNKDGHIQNLSWNCGHEGIIDVPDEVMNLRKRQVKNFCALLFLSNGTPMFCAGDEFMNTQQGNNNPYNQDNEITWLDWDLLNRNADVFRFFKQMISFRKNHASICRSNFWRCDILWYGASEKQVDYSYHSHCLAYCLHGRSQEDDDIYVMINSYWEDVVFKIHEGIPSDWSRVCDTSLSSPDDFVEEGQELLLEDSFYKVSPRSLVILLRKRKNIL